MDKANEKLENLKNIFELLYPLELLLAGSKSLSEDTEVLAQIISKSVPICHMALVQLTNRGEIQDIATWSSNGQREDQTFTRLVEKILPDMTEEFYQNHNVDNSRLVEMLSSEKEVPFHCWPIAYPIVREERMIGFAFFGKQKEYGNWDEKEKRELLFLMSLISVPFSNKMLNKDFALQSWVFNAVMDSMKANVYVTDVETDKILFMNKTMKETFGLSHPEGEVCWKVLQKDMEQRCEFCPVERLKRESAKEDNPSCLWEEHNTITGRIYENYDSLMTWIDGSTAHFQQSLDITDIKNLFRAARMDELTDMLNRRAGKEALSKTIQEARRENIPVTVCMYDVNGLKEVNDNYGHTQGDQLLEAVAQGIKTVLGERDYPFRLSGDEFIVVFVGTREEEVIKKITQVREYLKKESIRRHSPYEYSFCYGILEVLPEVPITLSEILTVVDERMYTQKRRFHIEKAEKRVREQKEETEIVFNYDKEHLYDALVESTDDYIYVCNMKTDTFRYPKSMVEEFELPAQVIKNAAAVWGAKVHEDDKQAFLEANQEIADGRTESHSVEYRAKNRKGEWVWLRCRGHLERDEKGDPSLFAGIITNLGKKNKVDHLTGLFNKFEFEDQLKRILSQNPKQHIGLILLGLDEFKHINDLHNRMFGDEVIRVTSQKMQALLPGNSSIYRLDGDEFAVILRGSTREEASCFYNALRNAFDHQQEYDHKKYYCTVSGGCVFYPEDANSYLDLLKYANYCLEYAKNKGKNRMEFFSKEILTMKERSLELIELLRESVEHDFKNFQVYYQAQVFSQNRKVMGAEALARWRCDKFGEVGPDEFIPLLEESGLIIPVGKWIFRQAAQTCARWSQTIKPFTVNINLSYLQLQDPQFIAFIEETIQEVGIDPSHIVVEMTESYIASNIELLNDSFQKIRNLGIKIAMDDFGTGYSSLGILKQSPADIVKIDRTFVKGIRDNSFDLTFIKFIVELCHVVDIKVCLEGMETQEEYEILKPMKLDYIQGFLFSRPLPAHEFEKNFIK